MEVIFYALITVIAWGTWLAPSQNVRYSSERVRTFYVAVANLLVALVVGFSAGLEDLNASISLFAGMGGLIWALSCFCAFFATSRLGIARAMGIWSPLNVVVSFAWGVLLFGELRDAPWSRWIVIVLAVVVALFGLRLILFANTELDEALGKKSNLLGIMAAVGAGVLWGSYFIPLQLAKVSIWVSVLPLSLGILMGSALGVFIGRDRLKLSKVSDYGRSMATGFLWGIGNYGSLKLMGLIGTGKGFTIAQLCVVVNALVGIYWFRQPRPGTIAARRALIGVTLATFAGIAIGLARYF